MVEPKLLEGLDHRRCPARCAGQHAMDSLPLSHLCPRCGGSRTITGLLSERGRRPYFYFKANPIDQFFHFLLPRIAVAPESRLCINRGLVWSATDPEAATEIIRKMGTDGMRLWLGLVDKKRGIEDDELA